jgi:hypothetical protein
MARPVFPFAAIVGQEDMKLAILVAAVDRGIGGVLVFGDRGTGIHHRAGLGGAAAADESGRGMPVRLQPRRTG